MSGRDMLRAQLKRHLEGIDDADRLAARFERGLDAGTDAVSLFDDVTAELRGGAAASVLPALELLLLEQRWNEVGVLCLLERRPLGWDEWKQTATVSGSPESERRAYVAVRRQYAAPFLLLERGGYYTVHTGVTVAPFTRHLFVGNHDTIEVFDLASARRLVEHEDLHLFWYFVPHEELVLAVCEMHLVAFEPTGEERWRVFIDPPHEVARDGDALRVEDFRSTRRIRIADGREA